MNTGTPNDGLRNGAETGLAGISVTLSDCASTVYASATTDGGGAYRLVVPAAAAPGSGVCVSAAVPGAHLITGASAGGIGIPDGVPTASAGVTYTYTRASQLLAFTLPGSGELALDVGAVPFSTFAPSNTLIGQSANTVSFAHTFTARTGGTVRFAIVSSIASPAISGWSEKILSDPGCTGTLQPGATLLAPTTPPTAITVVADERVCVIVQQFVPASALDGHGNTLSVSATLTLTHAAPALSASYTVVDVTTVGSTALHLQKDVRNISQGANTWGTANQAKSGERIEYRVTYTNNGTGIITGLRIADITPSYTTFVSAQAGATPPALAGCQKTTPANPAPAATSDCATTQPAGGTGAVSFQFSGSLNPGATGSVLFQVKVD